MAASYPSANNAIHTAAKRSKRPHNLLSIQTTIPTTRQTPQRDRHGRDGRDGRDRATTDLGQPIPVSSIEDRQAEQQEAAYGPGPQIHGHCAPLHIKLAHTTIEESQRRKIHHDPASTTSTTPPPLPSTHTPSAPIPIPPRHTRSPEQPVTPLTARVEEGNYFPANFYNTPQKPHFPGLRGEGSRPDKRPTNVVETSPTLTHPHVPARSSTMRQGQDSLVYTPTSPLSPTMPSPSAYRSRANARRTPPAPSLNLSALPRFHPANFPSKDSSASTSSRTTSRPSSSSHQHRPYSEAQFKLQQYQRELVASATRSSRSATSPTAGAKPSPPRLHPLGSPGPVTPMMLEGQGDYLIAGAGGANGKMNPVMDGRELVEKMIVRENERRKFAGGEERVSPAVSPAGGRG